MIRRLFIVARWNAPLFEHLGQTLARDDRVEVILDRRLSERRRRVQTHEPERRRTNRRRLGLDNMLRSHGVVFIRRERVG